MQAAGSPRADAPDTIHLHSRQHSSPSPGTMKQIRPSSPMKRFLDLLCAAIGLIFFSPLLVAVSIAIKLGDGGPILHRAERVGKDGRIFRLYKFRTMVVGAHHLGAGITSNGDTRITGIGRWLRRTKLDELPQLINVLRGEMSLVGPRPEDPRYVDLYSPEEKLTLRALPGMTSAASLAFHNEEKMLTGENWEHVYRTEVMPQKLAMDLDYLTRHTIRTDITLIVRTLAALFGELSGQQTKRD